MDRVEKCRAAEPMQVRTVYRMTSLPATRRELTTSEQRLIRRKIRDYTARGRRASAVALLVAGGVVFLLWLWTLLASDASWAIVTLFWLVVGGAIAVWVERDMRAHAGQFRGDGARSGVCPPA